MAGSHGQQSLSLAIDMDQDGIDSVLVRFVFKTEVATSYDSAESGTCGTHHATGVDGANPSKMRVSLILLHCYPLTPMTYYHSHDILKRINSTKCLGAHLGNDFGTNSSRNVRSVPVAPASTASNRS